MIHLPKVKGPSFLGKNNPLKRRKKLIITKMKTIICKNVMMKAIMRVVRTVFQSIKFLLEIKVSKL